ncbi:MAG: AAA family ATPase, partial [Candidatus Thorarchaeota archaeon]
MESILTAEPALVGRDQEIKQLRQHFESVMNRKGQNVFISGEAGVGKTKLVKDFLNQIEKTRITVLYGWCLSGAPIPYFPFIEAFNTYIGSLDDEKTKSFISQQLKMTGLIEGPLKLVQDPRVPELATRPRNEKDKTFEVTTQIILQLSFEEPVILFID